MVPLISEMLYVIYDTDNLAPERKKTPPHEPHYHYIPQPSPFQNTSYLNIRELHDVLNINIYMTS